MDINASIEDISLTLSLRRVDETDLLGSPEPGLREEADGAEKEWSSEAVRSLAEKRFW